MTATEYSDYANLSRLPKAHLHVHLESAVRWSTLREIGATNGVPVPEDSATFAGGFADFAAQNALVRDCLRRPEDFTRIAVEFCEDEAAQGTRYAEVTFTAAAHGERLSDLDMPLVAVLDGLAEGRRRYDIECQVIVDHSRRRSVERAWRTFDLATRYASAGVVAIGVAGDESFPLRPFVEVFDAAHEAGLHVVHHAGESRGAESIREAITVGRTERVGHGITVLEDEDLVAELRQRRIPLEVCPSSNVALGFAASLETHPLPRLRDAGLAVTVNTDIPSLIGTDLTTEYARVREAFGYTESVLVELARASFDASFASAATKARLHREADEWH